MCVILNRCDSNCRFKAECNWDDSACGSCQDNCFDSYFLIIDIIAGTSEPTWLVTESDVCTKWTDITYVHIFVSTLCLLFV